MFQAIDKKPPVRERRGVPAEQPVRIAHVVSVSGSHAVAILERSSEPALRAKDPRIQIGSVVKILTPGASVIGLVSSVSSPMPDIDGKKDEIGLIEDPRLWVRRAPGNTCLSSLGASAHFGDVARNNSKGCGTIMRVAPIALMFPRDQVRQMAIDTSALTHGHVTGQLAAAAWAEMLAEVAAGNELAACATRTAETYARLEGGEETARAIRAALVAPRDGAAETVESLGGGWTAEEALSIALYACLVGKSFEESLAIAVTHGGDSDSTGAIAGNMLGLLDPAAVLRAGEAGFAPAVVLEGERVRIVAAESRVPPVAVRYVSRTHRPATQCVGGARRRVAASTAA